MKVALSASYWQAEAVQKILRECDLIYTTNVRVRDELWRLFSSHVVHFIPCSTDAMLNFLRAMHEGDDFVTFSDLHDIFHAALASGDKQAILSHAKYLGWKIEPYELYDKGDESDYAYDWTKDGMTFRAYTEDEVPEGVINYHKTRR